MVGLYRPTGNAGVTTRRLHALAGIGDAIASAVLRGLLLIEQAGPPEPGVAAEPPVERDQLRGLFERARSRSTLGLGKIRVVP
jgi:hypothetical protein